MLRYFKNNNIFVFIYIYLVILTQIFINENNLIIFFFLSIINLFFSYFISLCLYKIINNININDKNRYKTLYLFLIDFFIIFTFAIIIDHFKLKIAGKYEFEFDMIQSIDQAMNNKYNEVRSPIFSLLFAKIPLLLSNNNLRFVTIYYYLIRSIIISYVISNLLNMNIILNILGILYYTCMPLSIHSELCIMKDTPCALFTLLLYFLIYKNKDRISDLNYSFDIIIVFLLLLINFMRPNAIIFVLLFIIILFYIYRNNIKRVILISVSFLMIFFLVNGPIYNIMGVERNSRKLIMHEISGFPVSVITYVSKNDISILNDKERQFVNELIKDDEDFFKDFNEKQGYESIKYRKNVSSTLENMSYTELLSYVADLLIRSPYLTLTQIINQTCSLYAYRYKNEHDINKFYAYVYYFFQNLEIPIILLLIITTIFIKNNKNINSNDFILALPIIIYSFLTCFIITSPWILRYYMQLQMVAPVIIINNLIKHEDSL